MTVGCTHVTRPETIAIGPAHEVLVPAIVNGTRLTLQLDTGASTTSLTPAARRLLGLRYSRPTNGGGAGGELANVEWVFLRTLKVAGEVAYLLPATVIDLDAGGGTIDGVLGMDVLDRYVVEIDLRARRLVLHREGDTSFRSPELVWASYAPLERGQITLGITVEGRPTTAILDLGANRTFANLRAGLAPDDAEEIVSAAVGADGHRIQFHAVSDVQIGFGELALKARSVWISDLPIFRTLGLADRPMVLLGTDVLAGRRIVIDPFVRRVYLSR